MTGPRCSVHGSMVRDLALGRLDDRSAATAEEALATCPTCSRWWEVAFEGEAAGEVDAVVASAIATFQAPAATRRWRSALLAAAAVLLIGVGFAAITRHTPAPVPAGANDVASVETATGTLVAALDFESGLVDAHASVEVVSKPAPLPAPKPAAKEAVVNAVSMENGDLSGWSSHS